MKITEKIVVLAVLVATSASAFAEVFIRPEILWSQGKLENLKSNKFGAGVAVGTTMGAQNEQEFGVSISQTNFTDTYNYQVVVNPAKTTGSTTRKMKALPVMFNYRYIFLSKTSKVRPYVGASIGLMSTKTDMNVTAVATNVNTGALLSSLSQSESKSTSSMNLGATAGLAFNITDRFALDLGYRYSQAKIKISEWALDGNLKINTVALGAHFRF